MFSSPKQIIQNHSLQYTSKYGKKKTRNELNNKINVNRLKKGQEIADVGTTQDSLTMVAVINILLPLPRRQLN